jgi:hypothetical protein
MGVRCPAILSEAANRWIWRFDGAKRGFLGFRTTSSTFTSIMENGRRRTSGLIARNLPFLLGRLMRIS